MIKAGIIGATGYAGNEIVRLLLGHKDGKLRGMVQEVILTRNMQMFIRTFLSW